MTRAHQLRLLAREIRLWERWLDKVPLDCPGIARWGAWQIELALILSDHLMATNDLVPFPESV